MTTQFKHNLNILFTKITLYIIVFIKMHVYTIFMKCLDLCVEIIIEQYTKIKI
jgi:hypothetical protein